VVTEHRRARLSSFHPEGPTTIIAHLPGGVVTEQGWPTCDISMTRNACSAGSGACTGLAQPLANRRAWLPSMRELDAHRAASLCARDAAMRVLALRDPLRHRGRQRLHRTALGTDSNDRRTRYMARSP